MFLPQQSHQRQHNKDKPYKCPNCYRAYSDSASLQIHLSAHAIKNAKAYCCSMCGRAYTSVSKPQVICVMSFRFSQCAFRQMFCTDGAVDKMMAFDDRQTYRLNKPGFLLVILNTFLSLVQTHKK